MYIYDDNYVNFEKLKYKNKLIFWIKSVIELEVILINRFF